MEITVKGYKYAEEQSAKNALNLINSFFGIPKPGCETKSVTEYQYSSVENIYYIIHDPMLESSLGQPEEFIITYPDPQF